MTYYIVVAVYGQYSSTVAGHSYTALSFPCIEAENEECAKSIVTSMTPDALKMAFYQCAIEFHEHKPELVMAYRIDEKIIGTKEWEPFSKNVVNDAIDKMRGR